MPICQLCQQDKKLVKSHIIPKFMFKKMKDDNNVFYDVSFNIDSGKMEQKKVQIEDYDNKILCENCDNGVLGSIERYANKVLYGNNLPEKIAPQCKNYINPDDGTEYTICKNIDYKQIKLFFLSILWRASITDRPYFNQVSLGKKHEEVIRKLILNNECMNYDVYPIVITSFLRTENTLENIIGQPIRFRTKSGFNGYLFLIDSLQVIIYVNSTTHKISKEISSICLKEDELVTLHLKNGEELKFLKRLFAK